jgi:uroporphyrinogen-III decarboxylase
MTSKERVLAAIRREPVDRVPCSANFNPLSAVQREGRDWQFPWPPDASAEERLRYQVEELGLDQAVGTGVSLCRQVDGVESRTWLEGDILHKAYSTPSGELHASVRHGRLWPHGEDVPFYSDFNIGHFVEPWLRTEADLECFQQVCKLTMNDEVLEQGRGRVAAARSLADKYDLAVKAGVGLGLTGAQQLFGATELCMKVIEEPDLVDACLEHEHQINLRTIEVLGDSGVDIIQRNGFYETADFYGPHMLEKYLGRRLRKETEAAHAAGMLMVYTAHTGLMPILDYLASLTMDSLFGIDIAFKGTDPLKLRDKLASTKSFWIGPSSTFHLWNGPQPTREAVRQVFEVFGKTGLILSPCVSAHSIMPWESTLAMIDEWKRLR